MTDTVNIRKDGFRCSLFLPQLDLLDQGKIRKLFWIALSCDWHLDNEIAVHVLDQFLPDQVEASKQAWAKASKDYQNGYRIPIRPTCREDKYLADEILSTNKQLKADVKSTKKTYEKWVKIQQIWIDTKDKMH